MYVKQSEVNKEYLKHSLQNDCHQKNPITNAGEDVEKKEALGIVGGNATWCSHSKKSENTNSKRYPHLHVHCSIIYNSPNMKTIWVFTDGWMDKEDVL